MRLLIVLLSLFAVTQAHAEKIAVTDLTYTDQVSGYFHLVDYHNKSSASSRYSEREHEGLNSYSASNRESHRANSQTDYTEIETTYSYIEYGELRKFVGDIKGEILKNGGYQLTQAKPYTTKGTEKIYDIIDRIKKGYYPGADYVLFGTVSDLEFRNEANPVIGSNTVSSTFSLMLVAEFSLINTRTYEVKAAFSANGEGQDVRLASPGSHVIPSRAKVISEVSKSLGEDVAKQLYEQIEGFSREKSGSRLAPDARAPLNEGEVIHFTQ